jgi:hypothetical protein
MLVEGKISQRIVQRVRVNLFLVHCGVVCPRIASGEQFVLNPYLVDQ